MSRLSDTLKAVMAPEGGFTLIELLVAMSIFSFMLLIVSSGFINIVHIHDQAVAANTVQDNARTTMDELVRGVRTSNAVLPSAANTLCLSNSINGIYTLYYVTGGVMRRADSPTCTAPGLNVQDITSSIVNVVDFTVVVDATSRPKQQVNLSITVTPVNGTAQLVSGKWVCGPNNSDRTFCSIITLNSGAVSR